MMSFKAVDTYWQSLKTVKIFAVAYGGSGVMCLKKSLNKEDDLGLLAQSAFN